MSGDYWQPAAPAEVPALAEGTFLVFLPDEVRHTRFKLRLKLTRVRTDISSFYPGEVWLDGMEIGADGMPMGWRPVLVRTSAIAAAVQRAKDTPGLE